MAADTVAEYRAVYLDPEGETSTVVAYEFVDSTITVAGLKTKRDAWCTAEMALSAATLQECTASIRKFDSFTLPAEGTFAPNIEDKLFLEFRSLTNGGVYTTSIPSPKLTDFQGDTETIDLTDASVIAYITYVQANGSTKHGETGLKFILGYRRRSKTRREHAGRPTAIG